MNLEKAIEILDLEVNLTPSASNPDLKAATKLGIEALKREQILRREIPYDRDGLLPGETKD